MIILMNLVMGFSMVMMSIWTKLDEMLSFALDLAVVAGLAVLAFWAHNQGYFKPLIDMVKSCLPAAGV